jgi:hypothetical protein
MITSRLLFSSGAGSRVYSIEPRGKKPLLEILVRYGFLRYECVDLDSRGLLQRFLLDTGPRDVLWFIVPKMVTGAPGEERCLSRLPPGVTTVVVLTEPVEEAPSTLNIGTVVWSPVRNPAPEVARQMAAHPRVSWAQLESSCSWIRVRHPPGFPADRRYLGFEG